MPEEERDGLYVASGPSHSTRGGSNGRQDATEMETKHMPDAVALRHAIAALEDLAAVLDEHRHTYDLLTDRAIHEALQALSSRWCELRMEARQARLF